MPRLNKLFLTLFFAASVMLGSCKTSTAPGDTTGGASGTLVYDIGTDSKIALYSFSTQRETIAFKPGQCPSWTPSGEILYEEPDMDAPTVFWKIALIASNGASKHVLLESTIHNVLNFKNPKMSKDGSAICFSYWLNPGGKFPPELSDRHATLLMKSDGTLFDTVDSLFDGSWMPDGSLVLSGTLDESAGEVTFYGGLYLLSADRLDITSIGSGLINPKHPAASPDGKKIAFAMSAHIWVINSDGTGLRQVTSGDKIETHPCWSPDGKYIACMSYGMFEVKTSTAIAAVPASNATTIDLNNDSPYWVKDPSQSSNFEYGRITTYSSISWK